MSADPSQVIETLAPPATTRRRRRRHSQRGVKNHHPTNRRFQRVLMLAFLGLVVIFASLYFAQRFTAYQPPPAVTD